MRGNRVSLGWLATGVIRHGEALAAETLTCSYRGFPPATTPPKAYHVTQIRHTAGENSDDGKTEQDSPHPTTLCSFDTASPSPPPVNWSAVVIN